MDLIVRREVGGRCEQCHQAIETIYVAADCGPFSSCGCGQRTTGLLSALTARFAAVATTVAIILLAILMLR